MSLQRQGEIIHPQMLSATASTVTYFPFSVFLSSPPWKQKCYLFRERRVEWEKDRKVEEERERERETKLSLFWARSVSEAEVAPAEVDLATC